MSHPDARPLKLPRYATGDSMSGRGRGWFYKEKYGRGGSGRRGGGGGGGGRGAHDGGTSSSSRWPPNQAPYTDAHNDGSPDARHGPAVGYYGEEREDDEQQEVHDGAGRAAAPAAAAAVRGSAADLRAELQRIDGRQYPAYKDIAGAWTFDSFTLVVDHVQGDAYAAPSRVRVQLPHSVAGFPPALWDTSVRRFALRDYLTRRFGEAVRAAGGDVAAGGGGGWHGAKGGDMCVDRPGQHVLDRTSVVITSELLEARFEVGLPARGRTVLGAMAAHILVDQLPGYVAAGLLHSRQDAAALRRHVECVEDSQALRSQLAGLKLVAFVADGALLPRASGASDLPLASGGGGSGGARDGALGGGGGGGVSCAVVPFRAPDSLAVEVVLPHSGVVRGMGLPEGVTLICGGGFHGKSTLLQALEVGVYDKVPGDGRERVVAVCGAVKVRAEDGRRVEGVDVSPYINNLPGGRDTAAFRTDCASGSTSQAACIQEALELGATCLLMDEDTCATNFMVRDARMAELVSPDREPITPLLAKVRALHRQRGVSTVLVTGASGDFFDVADTVVVMDEFRPRDATAAAKAIAARYATLSAVAAAAPTAAAAAAVAAAAAAAPSPGGGGIASLAGGGGASSSDHYGNVAQRRPVVLHPQQLSSSGCDAGVKIRVHCLDEIGYGYELVSLRGVEQLVDRSQTRAVAYALQWFHRRLQQQQQHQAAAHQASAAGSSSSSSSSNRHAQQRQQQPPTLSELVDELEAAFDEDYDAAWADPTVYSAVGCSAGAVEGRSSGVLSSGGGGGRPVGGARHQQSAGRFICGLDVLAPGKFFGNLARPRRFEIAAAVNRIRTLKVTTT